MSTELQQLEYKLHYTGLRCQWAGAFSCLGRKESDSAAAVNPPPK